MHAPCLSSVGRLAGLDAGLHQLHVRLHALDTRVVELSRGLRQLREAAGDTRDAVQALQEVQSRAERQHGRLEGESASGGARREERAGQVGARKYLRRILRVSGARGLLDIWGVLVCGELRVAWRVKAGSKRAVGVARSPPYGRADPTLAAPSPLQSSPSSLAPPRRP